MRRVLWAACAALLLSASPSTWATPDAATLAAHLAAHAPQCGRFEQSRWLADLETRLDSRGHFQQQENGLIWQTTVPVKDRVVLSQDNDALPLGFQVMLPVFTGLLSGDWQALERHFSLELSGELENWQARLVPSEAAVAERLTHLVVGGDQRVKRIELEFADGDRLDLRLTPAACENLGHGAPSP
ncbi:LolA-related protein [Litchfieldella rifensis]|uniref:LolA-related protein n=1 Tax=Litchfieldella rifensis TaxID=762643 RepID=A0ABV7LQW5_9GAMM